MFTAVPTGDIAFGTIELAAQAMDVEHVAMWPAAVDTHAGRTHGRAYTTSVEHT
jgi:hypothetical protein